MTYFYLKKAGGMLIALWISIGVPAIGMTDSPIWAPPDLARIIEEGIYVVSWQQARVRAWHTWADTFRL